MMAAIRRGAAVSRAHLRNRARAQIEHARGWTKTDVHGFIPQRWFLAPEMKPRFSISLAIASTFPMNSEIYRLAPPVAQVGERWWF